MNAASSYTKKQNKQVPPPLVESGVDRDPHPHHGDTYDTIRCEDRTRRRGTCNNANPRPRALSVCLSVCDSPTRRYRPTKTCIQTSAEQPESARGTKVDWSRNQNHVIAERNMNCRQCRIDTATAEIVHRGRARTCTMRHGTENNLAGRDNNQCDRDDARLTEPTTITPHSDPSVNNRPNRQGQTERAFLHRGKAMHTHCNGSYPPLLRARVTRAGEKDLTTACLTPRHPLSVSSPRRRFVTPSEICHSGSSDASPPRAVSEKMSSVLSNFSMTAVVMKEENYEAGKKSMKTPHRRGHRE